MAQLYLKKNKCPGDGARVLLAPGVIDVEDKVQGEQEERLSDALQKVTTPATPNGSSWERPCASVWSKIATKSSHC